MNWWVYSIGWVESTGCITSTSVDLRGTGNTPQSSAFRHNSNSQWLLMHVCNYDRSIMWCSKVHWRNDGNCGNCDNCMINYMSGVTKDTYGNVHLYAYGKRELVPSEDNIFWPSSAAKSIQLCKIIRCCNNHWRYFATHTRVWNTYGSTQGASYPGCQLVPRCNICIIWLCVPITLEIRELWTHPTWWWINYHVVEYEIPTIGWWTHYQIGNIATSCHISYHMNSLKISPHDGE